MNILFATNLSHWGGGEQWMLTAAVAMHRRGHAVSLAAPRDAAITARARDAGLSVLDVEFTRDFDPVSFARLLRHMHGHEIEVLCLNMDRVLRIAGLAARACGVSVVLPRRGSEFPLKDKWVYRFNYRGLATGMIVNSRATMATLCRGLHWRPAGTTHVLYNGLELSRFSAVRARNEMRREFGIALDAPVLLVVGELTSRKNAALLLSAAPAIRQRFSALKILLVGDGEEEQRLRAQVVELSLQDCVEFLGFRDDIPDLLGACDLLVHPAKVEGFGFAVAEALAAGRPVVASRASSIPEIVDDGETGLLFESEDEAGLRAAVLRYLEDPDLARLHGEEGRRRVTARFDLEDRSDELESIFAGELARARG